MWGLEAKNSSGEVQIDGEYRNLSLQETGTASVDETGSNNAGTTVSFNNAYSYAPLLAFKAPEDHVALSHLTKDGNGNFDGFEAAAKRGNTGVTLSYAVFTEASVDPGSGFGVKVLDASGNPVFSSAEQFIRIVSVSGYTNFGNINVNDANNNWFVIRPDSWNNSWNSSTQINRVYKTGIRKVDSTTISFDYVEIFSFPSTSAPDMSVITTPFVVLELAE